MSETKLKLLTQIVLVYNSLGVVGNKTPTTVATIQIKIAISIALSHPISYKALRVNNYTIPPAIAAKKPFPRIKPTIL